MGRCVKLNNLLEVKIEEHMINIFYKLFLNDNKALEIKLFSLWLFIYISLYTNSIIKLVFKL